MSSKVSELREDLVPVVLRAVASMGRRTGSSRKFFTCRDPEAAEARQRRKVSLHPCASSFGGSQFKAILGRKERRVGASINGGGPGLSAGSPVGTSASSIMRRDHPCRIISILATPGGRRVLLRAVVDRAWRSM